ncbi:unnamed protein product [Symbiodinium sp. KB8]|nr:unnamed protein product [Symbiodinium sp. KB8]
MGVPVTEYLPAAPDADDLGRYGQEKDSLESAGKQNTPEYAVALTNWAACLGALGDEEAALRAYSAALIAHEAAGSTDTPSYADTVVNVGYDMTYYKNYSQEADSALANAKVKLEDRRQKIRSEPIKGAPIKGRELWDKVTEVYKKHGTWFSDGEELDMEEAEDAELRPLELGPSESCTTIGPPVRELRGKRRGPSEDLLVPFSAGREVHAQLYDVRLSLQLAPGDSVEPLFPAVVTAIAADGLFDLDLQSEDRHRFNPHLLLELRPGSVGAGPQFLNRGLSFPRRQEAELAFTLSGRSALVSLAEVQREAGSPVSDRQIDIVCVSHRWEAREHPDPCRLLGQKVNS